MCAHWDSATRTMWCGRLFYKSAVFQVQSSLWQWVAV